MLAAADYGPTPTDTETLLSLAANKLLFLMSDEVCLKNKR
jgi:hypothetical protein